MLKKGFRSLFLVVVGFAALSPTICIKGLNFSKAIVVDDSVFEEARDRNIAHGYHVMKNDFKNAYDNFASALAIEAISIGEYSQAKMELFGRFVDDALNDFKNKCKAASDAALLSYYDFLDDQGRAVAGGKDATAQKLIEAIKVVRVYFENKVVQYKNTLMSGETLEELGAKLSADIDAFDIKREEDFQAQLAADGGIITHTGWENFVRNLEAFGPILGEKLLDGLAEVMEESIAKIGENAAKLLGELTSELTDYLKEKASDLLEKMGKEFSPQIKVMLDKALPKIEELLKLVGSKVEDASVELLFDMLKTFLKDLMKPEHEFDNVSVRTDNGLCNDEKMFASVRLSKATTALKKNFGISVPLKIATMSSGGGTRAMLGYMGFIIAAEKAGLWDAMLYNATASGSSWLSMPYSHAHVLGAADTMSDYQDALVKGNVMAANPPGISGAMLIGSADWFVKEFAYELLFSSSDLAGLFYANFAILDDDQTGARISDLSQGILSGSIPLPLCSGVYYKDNKRVEDAKAKAKEAEEAKAKKEQEAAEKKAKEDSEKKNGDEPGEKSGESSDGAAESTEKEDVEPESAKKEDASTDDIEKKDSEDAVVDANDSKSEDAAESTDVEKEVTAQAVESTKSTRYDWFEWSPFEAGGNTVGFVPVWAFGAEFKDGKPVNGIPEYPLYNLLGTWGSFYAASLNDVIDSASSQLPEPSFYFLGRTIKVPVADWIGTFLDTQGFNISETRLLAPKYFNFSQGLSTSPLSSSETIEVVASELDFDMPFPLLMDRSGREMDLIFMFHADPGIETIFADAILYFKREEVEYPAEFDDVTTESLASQPMTVFNDPRKESYQDGVPTFIYVPFLDCPSYADPYNFTYSGAQITEVSGLVEKSFTSQLAEMTEVMQILAVRKGDTELLAQLGGTSSGGITAQGLSDKDSGIADKAVTAHRRGHMDRVYRLFKEGEEELFELLGWKSNDDSFVSVQGLDTSCLSGGPSASDY